MNGDIKIITREEWKASPPRYAFEKHFPDRVTIHHQGSSAKEPKAYVMSMFQGAKSIKGIQNYHQNTNKWCFSLDTEILTDHGWKNYSNLTPLDRVYTVESGFTDQYEKLFFEDCDMVSIKTLNYSGEFTLDHKLMICKQHSVEYRRMLVSEVLKDINTPYRIQTSTVENRGSLGYSEDYCRLLSIIVCDGSFMKTTNYNNIEFGFKKERKINELFRLLNKLEISHNIYFNHIDRGQITIRINDVRFVHQVRADIFINNEKGLNWHLLQLSHKSMLALIDAYINSDGNTFENSNSTKKRTYMSAYSIVKKNMDILQAMSHLCGMRSKLVESTPKNGHNRKPLYQMTINPSNSDVIVDLRKRKLEFKKNSSWSVDCGGKLIMIRHNGCVQITSNCDIAYHAIIAPNGEIYQGRPFDCIGSHVKSNNTGNIGIMLIGNMEVETPTPEQIKSLKKLLIYLKVKFPQLNLPKRLFGHKDFMATDCPGKNLYPIVFAIKTGKENIYDIEPKKDGEQ